MASVSDHNETLEVLDCCASDPSASSVLAKVLRVHFLCDFENGTQERIKTGLFSFRSHGDLSNFVTSQREASGCMKELV